MKKTRKYLVKMQYPLWLDIEVEAENIEDARFKAAEIAAETPITEWADWNLPEVYETEFVDDDGIHTIL